MTRRREQAKLERIRPRDVRFTGRGWDAYLVRYRIDAGQLVASVADSGVIEPITVEPWRGGYRVIAGFLRAAAAREAGVEEMPALVWPKGTASPRDAYMLAISSNAPGNSLSDLDKAVALCKGQDKFGLCEEELTKTVCPLLGLAPSYKVVRQYLALSSLPHALLDAVADGRISRQHAEAVTLAPTTDREEFFIKAVLGLGLSASETRIFAEGLLDLAARQKRSFKATLDDLLCSGRPGVRTPLVGQKTREAAREALRRMLQPVVSEMEDEFAALAGILSLPSGAKVEHAQGFESDGLTITARIADAAGAAALKDSLERGVAGGVFEKMLSIPARKTKALLGKSGQCAK